MKIKGKITRHISGTSFEADIEEDNPTEPEKCEHEWNWYCTSNGNVDTNTYVTYWCKKCGEYKTETEPTEPPKRIEELTINYAIEDTREARKINECIRRINLL